ncbi:MAG: HepT-like ribonuclease domain-containing protein [Acidimicrobiales bacterium]
MRPLSAQLGEEAKRLPMSFKSEHSKIDLAQVAGMGSRLIHCDVDIDYEIVWTTLVAETASLVIWQLTRSSKNGRGERRSRRLCVG